MEPFYHSWCCFHSSWYGPGRFDYQPASGSWLRSQTNSVHWRRHHYGRMCLGFCCERPNNLFIARTGTGFGFGIACYVLPMYMAEVSPQNIRGTLGSLFQFMIVMGQL